RHPRHGGHHSDSRRPRFPWPRRTAALSRVGRDDLRGEKIRAGSVVGGGVPGARHLHREPRGQPAGRRPPRRARPQAAMTAPLLDIADLRVSFRTPRGVLGAVRGVSFTMGREKLGIVGESGSGKTLTGRSILRLLPEVAELRARRLVFDGVDLLTATPARLRDLGGRRLAMVMQDPKFSLNPVMMVGDQIAEAYLAHSKASRAEAREKALAMLEAVRIREPRRVYGLYPHEVSGGMGQRIMIAMMLAPDPDLLVADEPTSALDVTVQMQALPILD